MFDLFMFALGGVIAAGSIRAKRLPRGVLEWLIWAYDAFRVVCMICSI